MFNEKKKRKYMRLNIEQRNVVVINRGFPSVLWRSFFKRFIRQFNRKFRKKWLSPCKPGI